MMSHLDDEALTQIAEWVQRVEFQNALDEFLEMQRDASVKDLRQAAATFLRQDVSREERLELYEDLRVKAILIDGFTRRVDRVVGVLRSAIERLDQIPF
jgi:hypothetical protein